MSGGAAVSMCVTKPQTTTHFKWIAEADVAGVSIPIAFGVFVVVRPVVAALEDSKAGAARSAAVAAAIAAVINVRVIRGDVVEFCEAEPTEAAL